MARKRFQHERSQVARVFFYNRSQSPSPSSSSSSSTSSSSSATASTPPASSSPSSTSQILDDDRWDNGGGGGLADRCRTWCASNPLVSLMNRGDEKMISAMKEASKTNFLAGCIAVGVPLLLLIVTSSFLSLPPQDVANQKSHPVMSGVDPSAITAIQRNIDSVTSKLQQLEKTLSTQAKEITNNDFDLKTDMADVREALVRLAKHDDNADERITTVSNSVSAAEVKFGEALQESKASVAKQLADISSDFKGILASHAKDANLQHDAYAKDVNKVAADLDSLDERLVAAVAQVERSTAAAAAAPGDAQHLEAAVEARVHAKISKEVSASLAKEIATLRNLLDTHSHPTPPPPPPSPSPPPPPPPGLNREQVLQLVEEEVAQRVSVWRDAMMKEKREEETARMESGDLSSRDVRNIMRDELERYSADELGLPDYALESAGGRVVPTLTSRTYTWSGADTAWSTVFAGKAHGHEPNVAIQPGRDLGRCWAFAGQQGDLTVRLGRKLVPTSVSIDHVAPSVAHVANAGSAPKEMEFWARTKEDDKAIFLGKATYDTAGKQVQTFPLQITSPEPVWFVTVKVLSNHGHPDYTCLYRVRVHSNPALSV